MRILHTSDWHLGQNFFTKSRKDEHQAFIVWFLDLVKEKQIDAVIIAGDIFDTGAPPSYAREMYNQFVVDLNRLNCTLVVLGGNHDSVATLNESRQLLSCLTTYVVANSSENLPDQLIELKDRQGNTGALLCAVPFIRARDVLQSVAGSSGADKQKQLGTAIKDHYQHLYQYALERKKALGLKVPVLTTGHLTALGVTKTDSERDIYIGSLDGFAADGFPPADYIALGHIHRPQLVAKSEHIRYSGSPIPLSFDELKYQKKVILIEFDGEKSRSITPLDVPAFRRMQIVKGDLAEIEQQLKELESSTEKEKSGQLEGVWVSVVVRDQDFLSDLQVRIQAMTEDSDIEVIQLQRERGARSQALVQQQNETLSELNADDVFERRIKAEIFETEEEQQRLERITHAFREIVQEVESEGEE